VSPEVEAILAGVGRQAMICAFTRAVYDDRAGRVRYQIARDLVAAVPERGTHVDVVYDVGSDTFTVSLAKAPRRVTGDWRVIERLADVHVGELRGAIEHMTRLYLAIF
jgi:hypothetical protein